MHELFGVYQYLSIKKISLILVNFPLKFHLLQGNLMKELVKRIIIFMKDVVSFYFIINILYNNIMILFSI